MADLLYKNDISKMDSESLIKLRKSIIRVLNKLDRELLARVEELTKKK